jgi:hypothetical protein
MAAALQALPQGPGALWRSQNTKVMTAEVPFPENHALSEHTVSGHDPNESQTACCRLGLLPTLLAPNRPR